MSLRTDPRTSWLASASAISFALLGLVTTACTEPAPRNTDDDDGGHFIDGSAPGGGGADTTPGAPPSCNTEVPRDHASLAAAVEAMAPTGGTICVHAGGDDVEVVGTLEGTELTIVGMDPTFELQAPVWLMLQGGSVTIRQLRMYDLHVGATRYSRMTLLDSIVYQTLEVQWSGVLIDGVPADAEATVVIERNDLASVFVTPGDAEMVLGFRNNYVHDSLHGLHLGAPRSAGSATYEVANNTFVRTLYGLYVDNDGARDLSLHHHNNVFVDNDTAIALKGRVTDPSVTLTGSHNAFWGNEDDYINGVSPGTHAIFGDLLLDLDTWAPTPRPGSPLIDAAAPGSSPAYDFHGRRRGDPPDIGAVEVP